jgi:hypothetical protein
MHRPQSGSFWVLFDLDKRISANARIRLSSFWKRPWAECVN